MAVMTATRTLREAPFGNSLSIQANAGEKVKVLDDTTDTLWVQIELTESTITPKPTGWVNAQSVNKGSDEAGALDKVVFAAICVSQSDTFRVMAHYLMAIAHMRSNITNRDQGGGDHGPYALSANEWQHFGTLAEFGLNFAVEDRKNWTAQCMVFGAMANVTQRKFSQLLANQPTVAQLALAQLIGTSAALRVIRHPASHITDILAAVPPEEFLADAVDRGRLPDRYEIFLKDKTGEQTLISVAEKLQTSLDETKSFITQAGADFIEFSNELATTELASSEYTRAEEIASKTVKYFAPDGSTLIRNNGSRSWRKFNPGNISKGNFANNNGAIGGGTRFAIFPSEEVGLKAIGALLTGPSYRNLTLQKAMERYAPPTENDTNSYIAFIVSRTGIQRTDVMKDLTPAQLKAMAIAIQKHEGWVPGSEERTGSTVVLSGNITAEMIVRAAVNEWEHWGKSTHNKITGSKNIVKDERSSGFADYVYENYYKAAVKNPDLTKKAHMVKRIQEAVSPTYAWSACAISFFMKTAGYTKAQFNFSQSHSVYIRDAVAAKKNNVQSASFWGFKIDKAVPEVGDIVGYARKKSGTLSYEDGQAWYDKTGGYLSHSDVVVAVRSGVIEVIGGNVSDSLTKKILEADPITGKLIDRSSPWFVVMKRRNPV
ncbi:MAG: DUF2272 domain-containing protein [Hyphomicrobiales bacterium]|nr:DUF2272 domain-containing protein [Hyphomicrobiales bacterium]